MPRNKCMPHRKTPALTILIQRMIIVSVWLYSGIFQKTLGRLRRLDNTPKDWTRCLCLFIYTLFCFNLGREAHTGDNLAGSMVSLSRTSLWTAAQIHEWNKGGKKCPGSFLIHLAGWVLLPASSQEMERGPWGDSVPLWCTQEGRRAPDF